MAKKQFKIRARIAFTGEFVVRASSREQAEEKIKQSCGCTLGNIQSLDENIDWEFPVHGEIEIKRKQQEEQV